MNPVHSFAFYLAHSGYWSAPGRCRNRAFRNYISHACIRLRRSTLSLTIFSLPFGSFSSLYFIMLGHAVYPDIIDGSADWNEKVKERFARQEFPKDSNACSTVTAKFWLRQYHSAETWFRNSRQLKDSMRAVAVDSTIER